IVDAGHGTEERQPVRTARAQTGPAVLDTGGRQGRHEAKRQGAETGDAFLSCSRVETGVLLSGADQMAAVSAANHIVLAVKDYGAHAGDSGVKEDNLSPHRPDAGLATQWFEKRVGPGSRGEQITFRLEATKVGFNCDDLMAVAHETLHG